MSPPAFPALPRSLKARLTLLTLAVFLACTGALAVYVETLMHNDVEKLLAGQQLDTSTALAHSIDRQVTQRLLALDQVARMAGTGAPDPARLRALLRDLPVFQNLFNGGTFFTDARGRAVAAFPAYPPREGMDFSDREYVAQVLAGGSSVISRPLRDRASNMPAVVMAHPVRDSTGRLVGVLAGITDLAQPGFLTAFPDKATGPDSNFVVVSPRHRQVVTSSDTDRILATLPPPGASPSLDQFLAGFEGTTTFIDPRGIEVVASVRRIPSAGWYVAVATPTEVAFAPAHAMLRRMLVAAALLAAASAALVWWMMRRELAPLDAAARRLGELPPQALAEAELPALPVVREDEIGTLFQAFNRLGVELARQRRERARSEVLYSTAFRTSPDAISITRMEDGRFVLVNDSFGRMFGWNTEEIVGQASSSLGLWRRPQDRLHMVETLRKRGRCEELETEFTSRDGRVVALQMSAALIELDGQPCILAVTHDITARKQAQAQIETLAFSDPLTGLPNRRLFMERLHQAAADAARDGRPAALLYIDLDDFKLLNDRMGHEQGDLLLRAIGSRLLEAVRSSDTVGRLGGDEFVVLLRDLDAQPGVALTQARAVGQALLARLREPVAINGTDYHGSASIGIALLDGQGVSAGDTLRRADLAMYHAKSEGRDRLCVFDPRMQQALHDRAELEGDLRAALEDGTQLRLHYQPQVDGNGRVVGAEALVRWQHPTRGLVSPGEFIPVAEDSGLIAPLGDWVLAQACRQLAAWSADPRLAGIRISVNVSSRQFEQPDFVDRVLERVRDSGIEPNRLKLELTESLLIDHIEDITAKMTALGSRGIGFALDDFGTGFSSLSYLKRLPFDELKIDQGFVRDIEDDPNDLAIARMIVALGSSLGLAVVAEGVETEAQQRLLAAIGCPCCQGYLFSKPVPAAQFEDFARSRALALVPA